MTSSDIFDWALGMPERDRAHLAHQLLLSLDDDACDEEWQARWAQEINARMNALEQGRTTVVDWRLAMTEMRANLKKRELR